MGLHQLVYYIEVVCILHGLRLVKGRFLSFVVVVFYVCLLCQARLVIMEDKQSHGVLHVEFGHHLLHLIFLPSKRVCCALTKHKNHHIAHYRFEQCSSGKLMLAILLLYEFSRKKCVMMSASGKCLVSSKCFHFSNCTMSLLGDWASPILVCNSENPIFPKAGVKFDQTLC